MASIEKRGDYTYRITVSNGYDRNGKKIVHKRTVTIDASLTQRQAEKEIERVSTLFEDEIKKGNVIDSNTTFEKFTQKWLVEYAEKRLEKTTVASYKFELDTKILPSIGHIKLPQLKPLHLSKFYDSLTSDGVRLDKKEGGYSTRIIKYQHSIISSILQTAVYWQVISDNITRKVKPPKGVASQKGENFFDEKQIKEFLTYVQKHEPIEYVALALVTAYGCLRKGEVLGLNWSDITFDNNSIRINKVIARAGNEVIVKQPKNKSSVRVVTLPQSVMKLLMELKLVSTTTAVFSMNYSTPSHWFKRVVRQYNENNKTKLPPDVTFHGLRHTSATLLIAQGMDIKTISSRLGHSDVTTTLNVYAHAIKSKDQIASDILEDIIKI